jgi:hypothetical protein
MKAVLLLLFSCCLLLLLNCKKDSFITSRDANLLVSADTLHYDTVFTSAGSVTQAFKIINDNNRKLRLTSVQLMGGNNSSFKMNVDGVSAGQVNDIEIAANDSIYVFVQVNIDPASGNLPFIVRDSIQISFNGNERLVQLEAWGQNAHFLKEKEVVTDEVWTNDLPYVILGYLYVAAGQNLSIEKGCRVYSHADAPIIVDGTIRVNGERDTASRVYFQGDRLDVPYKDFPAAWPGIYFRASSVNNVFNNAVIKNAYQAIALEDPASNANPKLTLNDCIIDNAYDAGIVALNSSISAYNCLISNCGKNMALVKGGNYQFTHCTAVTIPNNFIQHRDPVLTVSNTDGAGSAALSALFRNCIFWGESEQVEDEVIVVKNAADLVNFDHNLWKVKTLPQDVIITENINNNSPLFDSINTSKNYYNFRLRPESPAIDKGNPVTQSTTDLDGKTRLNVPDLGCFEKQ